MILVQPKHHPNLQITLNLRILLFPNNRPKSDLFSRKFSQITPNPTDEL